MVIRPMREVEVNFERARYTVSEDVTAAGGYGAWSGSQSGSEAG
jgi:hypothetical protein